MSKKRQNALFDRRGRVSAEITALTYDYRPKHRIPWHFHEWDQLVYATSGVMTVRTEEGTWVVPTLRAVWIPAGVAHSIVMSGAVSMRTLYLKPKLAAELPRACCVVNVSGLLKELIVAACRLGALEKTVRRERHLIDVILDQFETVQLVPLQLRNPKDLRAKRVADVLMGDPGETRTLAAVCKSAGASKRTIERLFRDEVGMTLGKWRQQLRLMEAMRLLAEGEKVTHAALEAGYSAASAFIAMFGRTLGTTPRAYFQAGGREKAVRHKRPVR